VYVEMEWWTDIRRKVLIDGVSKRSILRETGMHWQTLEKILTHSSPPGYQLKDPRPEPKIGPFRKQIAQIIDSDKDVPKKQRHTAKKIHDRLRQDGYAGGYTQVKEAVRQIKRTNREVFMPLIHRPGEAQVDFGHALANIGGVLQKIVFFVMSLPHSDAVYVQAYPRICTEAMWDGHVKSFFFFGGVPTRITYDNDKTLVAGVLGGRDRNLTDGFLQLQSHYLFDHHFCLVRRANEKGVVESMVRYTRSNFMVPVPQVRNFEELNDHLEARCLEELARTVRGKNASKALLLKEDQAVFRALPDAPLVDICRLNECIASHKRLWGKGDVRFEPVHYLRLLERKPGALDHARPLEGWALPECFSVLRRRLENEDDGEGTREYIRVLRLLEDHKLQEVRRAVERGLRINAHSRDAIAQFLFPHEDWQLTSFRLDGREHLRGVKVELSDIDAYSELLVAGGAS